ncbi:MAG: aldo/keto reductase [Candidatus Cyclobacteriaceae bacterium M3_2C_046]
MSTNHWNSLRAYELKIQTAIWWFFVNFTSILFETIHMHYRQFGQTDLKVSQVGFGAWAIGGPAMAGDIPIGWGDMDDETAIKALKSGLDRGINFYDTADFYGLGHSEALIGQVFGSRKDVIIATKVGHRLDRDQNIILDYSKDYILQACESSLKRLKRETIDYYQLHTAKVGDLINGGCLEALDQLKQQGKIRYWGISLHTYDPEPEAEYIFRHQLGSGFQLVFNIINQKALPIIQKAGEQGMGVIARMPLQFGLLTGKFNQNTRFASNDHRSFRLSPPLLTQMLDQLEDIWPISQDYQLEPIHLALSFILSHHQVSTVIPGIKNQSQAVSNTQPLKILKSDDLQKFYQAYEARFQKLLEKMAQFG